MAAFTDDELAVFERLDDALAQVRLWSADIVEEITKSPVNHGRLQRLREFRDHDAAEVTRLLKESNDILRAHGVEL